MDEQQILSAEGNYAELDKYFMDNKVKSIFLVCGNSITFLSMGKYFDTLAERKGIKVVSFSDFQPNPQYESIVKGVKLFCKSNCNLIVAVGGGSAIDVAKCIKLYSNMSEKQNYLNQTIIPNNIKLLAVPTTAGTGSEATKYAVIYYNGEKQSIAHKSCIPNAVLMDASTLKTLPIYQKKVTMLDALCHSIESFWSLHSTEESRSYSKRAIQMIIGNLDGYLANDDTGNANMLKAANLAGKAINIAQTTAGHAMSYKLTSLYGIAHGHAVAICILKLWPFMQRHPEYCVEPRGIEYLNSIYQEIAKAMGCEYVEEAIQKYTEIYVSLELKVPEAQQGDYEILKRSVNPIRLKNHPVQLDENTLNELYHQILYR